MGEVAEMMLDGTLCQQCGVFIDDAAEGTTWNPGVPRSCRHCRRGERRPKPKGHRCRKAKRSQKRLEF